MALVLADRVQETTTTSGTGSVTLAGATAGFQSFAVIGNGNTCYYAIVNGSAWEVGIGTYSTTGPTLARTTVLSNSNGNTSAITLSGSSNVFVTYPAERSVNVDAGTGVTLPGALTLNGTIASNSNAFVGGSYDGNQFHPTNGGGAQVNSLRDGVVTVNVGTSGTTSKTFTFDINGNLSVNRVNQANTNTSAAGGVTTLTAASTYAQTLTGTGNQTYTMPDATTLTTGTTFSFNNNATGTLTLQDYASGAISAIAAGGAGNIILLANGTTAGTWNVHGFLPENILWGTNSLYLASDVITGGTWNGGTIATGYGGTGLTTFTGANNALYSTSASALAAGTLPFAAGGTSATTRQDAMDALAGAVTSGQYLRGNGTDVVMSAIQVADVPTLNQNTTGNAATATTASSATNIAGGGTYQVVYQSSAGTTAFVTNGTTGQVLTANTSGAPTWAAVAATSATNLTGGGAYTVVYQSSAGTTAYVTNGTTGQVLTANTGGAPTWAAASGGGLTQAKATAISLIFGL
jgi:hypothetical protein